MDIRIRPRRLRQNEAIRSLVRENVLSPNDFIVPLFIEEGLDIKSEIPSMPEYFRYSLDRIDEELDTLLNLNLTAVLLFVKVDDELKDNAGTEAWNENGLMQKSIKHIKKFSDRFLVMTDVALDPYSNLGHDGIVSGGKIINDDTVSALCKMANSHAHAGADFIAPSDMMDGRIGALRDSLDKIGFSNVGIMSYAAKYASSFYGPFREALDSAPVDEVNVPKDKKTYQMDPANRAEALKEIELDINEGADILMIKPGLPYLDIIRDTANMTNLPIAAYHVSGEYAMIKAAAEKGWIDEEKVMMETLISLKRAGATLIASYFAKEAVRLLNKKN